MNTDQLRLFLIIARHRSLSRAAAELDLGQATVSDRLRGLEAELGARLFERRGHGVALTPAGQAFQPYAERALEVLGQAQTAVRAASEGHSGQVSVAVTVTSGAYLFAPALVAFQREHPKVEVKVRSAHSWDAPGLILDGVAQLALISGSITHPQIESLATFAGRLALVAGTGVSLLPEIAVRRELEAGDLVPLELADPTVHLPVWEITLIRRRRSPERSGGEAPNSAAEALTQTLIRVLPGLTR